MYSITDLEGITRISKKLQSNPPFIKFKKKHHEMKNGA